MPVNPHVICTINKIQEKQKITGQVHMQGKEVSAALKSNSCTHRIKPLGLRLLV